MSEHRTNGSKVVASSIGRTKSPRSVTFEVSDPFLDVVKAGEWSEPIRFRFEEHDGRWDLVMRRDVENSAI